MIGSALYIISQLPVAKFPSAIPLISVYYRVDFSASSVLASCAQVALPRTWSIRRSISCLVIWWWWVVGNAWDWSEGAASCISIPLADPKDTQLPYHAPKSLASMALQGWIYSQWSWVRIILPTTVLQSLKSSRIVVEQSLTNYHCQTGSPRWKCEVSAPITLSSKVRADY